MSISSCDTECLNDDGFLNNRNAKPLFALVGARNTDVSTDRVFCRSTPHSRRARVVNHRRVEYKDGSETMITEPPVRRRSCRQPPTPSGHKGCPRQTRSRAKIGAEDLKAIEDKAISRAVAKEASLGLKVVTDGEYRRKFLEPDFFRHLDNVETFSTPTSNAFRAVSRRRWRTVRPRSSVRSLVTR